MKHGPLHVGRVNTAKGKSALLRVVTYGDTTTNSIDVSPSAFQILNVGEDNGGFGKGSFSLRMTSIDGTQVTDTFSWPASGLAGQLITGATNF